ncbi:MAG: hypothetical protein CBB92_03340 [Flammeovirgaceae bacterium TMED32]|nr:MAG: hypothetical protein CBB92_03340 [Flammeovirgaceae bacterium TMED32]
MSGPDNFYSKFIAKLNKIIMKLVALYPQPKDVEKFNSDYNEHILFLNKKLNIPTDVTAYEVTNFVSGPFGKPAYYKMWVMPFDSQKALNSLMGD